MLDPKMGATPILPTVGIHCNTIVHQSTSIMGCLEVTSLRRNKRPCANGFQTLMRTPLKAYLLFIMHEEEVLPLTYKDIDVDLCLSDQTWGATVCGKHSERVAVSVFSVQHVVEENLHREWAGL